MSYLFNRFVAAYILFGSANIFTMNANPIKIQEVTIVPKAWLAGMLINNHALIANTDAYHIIELTNNHTITKKTSLKSLTSLPFKPKVIQTDSGYNVVNHDNETEIFKQDIPVHPFKFSTNKTRNLVGIQALNKFLVYDVHAKTTTWQLDIDATFSASAFTPNNIFWILKDDGTILNNLNKEYTLANGQGTNLYCCPHPTKEEIFYTQDNGSDQTYLCTINVEQDQPTLTKTLLPSREPSNLYSNQPATQLHSQEGSTIAFYWTFDGNWSLYNHEKQQEICKLPDCNNLALHPTKPVVGMITKDGVLQLYNFETNTLLAESPMKTQPYPSTTPLNKITMDFSLDGTQLIFILRDKCYLADIAPAIFNR